MILRDIPLQLHPPGEWVSDHIRSTGDFYEANILEVIVGRLQARPPGLLIDIGAMMGTHTVFLSEFAPHTFIHAFEPCHENFQLLIWNTAGRHKISRHKCAVSDRRTNVLMGASAGNMGHVSILATDHTRDKYEREFYASAVTLDEYAFENVRLIKIDVEGHEAKVLAGARETIERCAPMIVVEDWHQQYAPIFAEMGYYAAAEWWSAHQTTLYEKGK